jgi:hypothetical protein
MLMMPIMAIIGLRAVSITVGPVRIACDYAIWTAPVFGSSTPARGLWVIRTVMTTPGIGLLLALGRIQAEHVQ